MADYARVRVVGLCGSMKKNSTTHRALEIALHGARDAGASAAMVDLGEYRLPFAGQTFKKEEYSDVGRLSEQCREADGIIWATPEYHGSFSGVLKNALDLMGFDEFEGKMIGLVGVAGGSIGAINALTHLRTVGRQLHAWVLPQQVSVARSRDAFDDEGRMNDLKLEEKLKEIGQEVTHFARLHSTRADDFIRQWEKAAENPGGQKWSEPDVA